MAEKGYLMKTAQDELMVMLKAWLEKKEIKKAGLIVLAASVALRLLDDGLADKAEGEELKLKARALSEKVIVEKDLDAGAIVEFILEVIDLFTKD